jgi:predicted glycosyltransferase
VALDAVRILMYSSGMGSACCTLTIATHLSEAFPGASFLVLTDLAVFGRLRLPPNLDYVHVPRLPELDAPAAERQFDSSEAAADLRRRVALATFASFDPHMVIVDRFPLGAGGELAGALQALRGSRPRVRLVAGLWDVPGAPGDVGRAWADDGIVAGLSSLYDEVWVYGTPDLFDPVREFGLPAAVARKVVYTGYLRHRVAGESPREKLLAHGLDPDLPLVLVTLGGGRGGFPLADGYLRFLESAGGAGAFQSHVVCGPLLSDAEKDDLEARAARLHRVSVDRFHKDLSPYFQAASVVVSTSGFNTWCQILSFEKRAVLVPRADGGSDQRVRAEALAGRGLVEMLAPHELTPERLGEKVLAQLRASGPPPRAVPLDGLETIAKRLIRI